MTVGLAPRANIAATTSRAHGRGPASRIESTKCPVHTAGSSEGWATPAAESAAGADTLERAIAISCEEFDTISSADLEPLLQRIGNARAVLLGEATHGSFEFYRMRERISRELIDRKEFSFIALQPLHIYSIGSGLSERDRPGRC
jgi:hypothetical protein